MSDWLRAGTQMVVVIDPTPTHRIRCTALPTIACMLTEGDMLDGGDVVPGWKMPLAHLILTSVEVQDLAQMYNAIASHRRH